MFNRALLILAVAAILLAAQERPADLVLVNGKFYTVDPARPRAEAVAGDRIVALGTRAEIEKK